MQNPHIRTASLEHLLIQHGLAHSMHNVVKTLGSWWPILSQIGFGWLIVSFLFFLFLSFFMGTAICSSAHLWSVLGLKMFTGF
jgi:hypothetical protein